MYIKQLTKKRFVKRCNNIDNGETHNIRIFLSQSVNVDTFKVKIKLISFNINKIDGTEKLKQPASFW
jgi:hypothetical protein